MSVFSKLKDLLLGGLSSGRLTEASSWAGFAAVAMAMFGWDPEQWNVIETLLTSIAGVILYFWPDKGDSNNTLKSVLWAVVLAGFLVPSYSFAETIESATIFGVKIQPSQSNIDIGMRVVSGSGITSLNCESLATDWQTLWRTTESIMGSALYDDYKTQSVAECLISSTTVVPPAPSVGGICFIDGYDDSESLSWNEANAQTAEGEPCPQP